MKKSWTAIWTEIAEAFDTPIKEQTAKQEMITWSGLCYSMDMMGKHRSTPRKIVPDKPGWWWNCDEKGSACRATLAGFMAAMGSRGFKSFLKWCEEHP